MASDRELGAAPLGGLLFKMCSHTTLSLMIYSMYSAADTFFISKGVGSSAAGAVSLAMPLMILLSALSTMAGSGGASCISRALGSGDKQKAAKVTANAFLLFWGLAVIVTIVGIVFLDVWLQILGVPPEMMGDTRVYAAIILAGAVTSTGFSSFMRAEGDTRFSLFQWVIPVGINVILDALFLFVFQMGVAGAAFATVLAQVVSVGMSMWFFFFRSGRTYTIRSSHFKPDIPLIREMLLIGSPAFLQQSAAAILIMTVNKLLGIYGGAAVITAYGFVTKIQNMLLIPQQGIAQGIQPVAGYNYARGTIDRIERTMKLAFAAAVLYGIAALAVSLLGRTVFMRIFTAEQAVVQTGAVAIVYVFLAAPLKGVSGLVSVYFQAVGRSGMALMIPLAGTLGIQMPLFYLMSSVWGLQGIWLAFPAGELLLFILAYLCYKVKRGERRA